MTSNPSASHVADWPSNTVVAETSFGPRRIRPRSQPEPADYRTQTVLDPMMRSPDVQYFESDLRRRLVGQDRAIRQLARVYQVHPAGLSAPGRPLANLLLLGPTGCGKTRLVEAAAEVLFGDPQAVVSAIARSSSTVTRSPSSLAGRLVISVPAQGGSKYLLMQATTMARKR